MTSWLKLNQLLRLYVTNLRRLNQKDFLASTNKSFFRKQNSHQSASTTQKSQNNGDLKILSMLGPLILCMDDNKSLQKMGRGSMDYKTYNNSGIIIVKWIYNSVVQLVSNFCSITPMSKISGWCKKDKLDKDIPWPAFVMQYNKSMVRVDLADMLIALYCISCKTKRWYQKIFWHLINMAKVNAGILDQRHANQGQIPIRDHKTLLVSCIEIFEALIYINNTSRNQRGRPSKRKSVKLTPRGKGPQFIYLLLIYVTTD